MSSLSPKDRVSLCSFTFSDGRRCRTPRAGKHPRFCFYHAQKEARARAAETLGKDLAFFFSGDYLSACDLSTALARLIPAVVRGAFPSTNIVRPSTPMTGAKPSAIPLEATTTTASRPTPSPNSPDHPSLSPSLPSHLPKPHNGPHRRTLPCLPRAPNSFSM